MTSSTCYKNYERFRDVQPVVKKLSHVKMDDYNEQVWRSAIRSCPSFDLLRWGEFAELIDVARAAWLDRRTGLSLHEFIKANPKMLEKLGISLRQSRSSSPKRSPGFSVPAKQDGQQIALVPNGKPIPVAYTAKRPIVPQASLDKIRKAVSPHASGVLTPQSSSQGLAAQTRTNSVQRGGGSPVPQQGNKPVSVPALKRAESGLSRTNSSTSLSINAADTVPSRCTTPSSNPSSRKGDTLRDHFVRGQAGLAGAASASAAIPVPVMGPKPTLAGAPLSANLGKPRLRRTRRPVLQHRSAIAV